MLYEVITVLVKLAQLGLTGDIAVAPQAGATSPAALAGTLAQTFAETLSCLCVMNLVRPGSPINFGMWPFISDLRTGAFTGGSGEEALAMAASAQLCNHFGFITSMASGMTDAKVMDAQAGYEKAITTTVLALTRITSYNVCYTKLLRNPARPWRCTIGASTTTNAAVGPVTWNLDPPAIAATAPATMAV